MVSTTKRAYKLEHLV